MRLFHVSEESNIEEFVPRIPYRKDVDQSKGLVWALTELQLKKFLTPRDCPRATYRPTETSTQEDIDRFFSSSSRYCVAIEHGWYKRMANTVLYIYEFDMANFYFDDAASFYVSEESNIKEFVPRIPYRMDVHQSKGLVWALTELQLKNS